MEEKIKSLENKLQQQNELILKLKQKENSPSSSLQQTNKNNSEEKLQQELSSLRIKFQQLEKSNQTLQEDIVTPLSFSLSFNKPIYLFFHKNLFLFLFVIPIHLFLHFIDWSIL